MAGTTTLKLLMIEDNEADFLLAERTLKKLLPPFESRRVDSNAALQAALGEETWDIVLTDYSVPGMNLVESLGLIHHHRPDLPVILVSGSIGDEQAVALVKEGVWDFVLKDNLVRLAPAIERGLQEAADHRARAEAETALRTLVDAIPESAVLTAPDGTILAANETIARRYGRMTRQLIGTRLYDLLPPDVAEHRKNHAAKCVATGEPLHFEDSRFGRFIDNYIYPIKDARGNVLRLAVLEFDITERRETEEKLKEQAALLDVASDAVLVKDLDNRILYWNKSAERMYGWSSVEAVGKDTSIFLFSEAYVLEAAEAWKTTLAKGEWRGDLHQKKKDGTELLVEERWTLMRNEQGSPKGFLTVNSNVTTQRAIQTQLLRSQRLESLGSLAGGIAHDLNNVLSPILMGVEGLSFSNPSAGSRKILEIIKVSAQRGAEIVRQILNFARGTEGEHGELQLKHVLREVESIIRETFERSITLKSEVPRDLWPVMGDATQLHQVIMNLAVNARDAMPGGGLLTLRAENIQLDETYAAMNIEARAIRYVVVTVEDTGAGITAGTLEKIFDPFFTTKDPGKGTGLGLSTARTIVKGHGGFINVYSEPGKGASFKIYIPAAAQKTELRDENAPEEGVPMGEGEVILLVEDEITMRDMTQQLLESYGYQVLTAADGTEAVGQFVEHKTQIRLVITDMMMPFMDGAATIRALRKIEPAVRVVAMSGLMVSEYASEAKDIGAIAFLAKPFTAEALLQVLREALESPRAGARE
jgi:PAS domain S-box-containing protein